MMKTMKMRLLTGVLAGLLLAGALCLAGCDKDGKDAETASYQVADTGVGDIVDWNA